MNQFFKQAEHYKTLGKDGAAFSETIKSSLIGAAYKEAFERLCDALQVDKRIYLVEEKAEATQPKNYITSFNRKNNHYEVDKSK